MVVAKIGRTLLRIRVRERMICECHKGSCSAVCSLTFDPVGPGQIYVQAKRYAEDNVVGRPAIQGFVGALAARGATVGVFFTTSKFSKEAIDAAERVPQDIALVVGLKLTELMIKHRVGVQIARRVEIVKIDEDFFSDE